MNEQSKDEVRAAVRDHHGTSTHGQQIARRVIGGTSRGVQISVVGSGGIAAPMPFNPRCAGFVACE